MKKTEKLQRELEKLLFETMRKFGELEIDFENLTIEQLEALNDITHGLPQNLDSIDFASISSIGNRLAEIGKDFYDISFRYFDLARQAPDYNEQEELALLVNMEHGGYLIELKRYEEALPFLAVAIESAPGMEDQAKRKILVQHSIGTAGTEIYANMALAYEKLKQPKLACDYAMKAIAHIFSVEAEHGDLKSEFGKAVTSDTYLAQAQEIVNRLLQSTGVKIQFKHNSG